ncbi:MAG: calcium-binding protein, partial [Pseudomonadota bacterium]
EGGDGNDMIVAHFGDDVYVGGEGQDTLDMSMASRAFVDLERGEARGLGRDQVQGVEAVIGSSGNDRLRGDDADNVLTGNAGRDSLSGRSGNDVLDGGEGDDRLSGGSGDDTLVGGEGQDRLNGGSGNDDLSGGDGNDRLWGLDGDDVISDGAGDDRVGGGRGDDVVVAGEGNDFYNGGRGFDTIDFSGSNSALTIDVGRRTATGEDNDRFSSFEKVIGSDFADNMRGSNRVDHLDGGAGDDVIQSLRGADILTGGEGDDTYVFAANDVVRGSRHFGADTITDFEEGDTIDLSGLFRGNDFDAEAVRLTETEVGTVVEAQIGRGGTFVDVVVLDGVFGLDTETITDDGLLVG